jgi:serine/threonine protein kinase
MIKIPPQGSLMPSPLDHPPTAKRLGDFEIVREVGRGGMGVVYEARQVSLNRKVALKVLSGGLGLSPQAVPRFHREAEAGAKLHHTNIVPVYATGEENGAHFYAMEFIEGPSLDAVIRQLRQARSKEPTATPPSASEQMAATCPYVEGSSPSASGAAVLTASSLSSDGHYFDTVAKMMADVADALAYAHKQGVIHRDIKPSNLLLSPDGRLSINDFGLARMLEEPGMTMTGEFVGTPAYMSPEQIAAGRAPIDHRTDIYSLGATLYELLTLQPPFAGKGRDQLLAQILHKELKAPRRINRKAPVDLETICLKAMDKDPDRRYQTAGELAADLRRYVNRFAIAARRAGPIERFRKWVKRRPGLAAALALAVVALGVAGYFGYQAHLTELTRLALKDELEKKLQAERRQNALEKATEAAFSGDLERARKAIVEAESIGVSADQVHWLNGLVHFQRGNYDDAIKEFKSAVALKQSVAAQAMLTRAYFDASLQSGNPFSDKWLKAFSDLGPLTPVTPEDYMCRGYALGLVPGDQPIKDLDTAIAMRDSPIARAFRADRTSLNGFNTGDLQLTQRAIDDMQQAKLRLPDNSFIRFTSIHVYLNAAVVYDEAGQHEKETAAALKEAEGDAEALNNKPVIAYVMARVLYFQQVGKEDAALELLQAASAREETKELVTQYALALYRKDQVKEALRVLDESRQPENMTGQVLRTILMAEAPEIGSAKAYDSYLVLAARHESETGSKFAFPSAAAALLFLGMRQKAAELVRDADRTPEWFMDENPLTKYLEGGSEEEYLKTARGGRLGICFNHFVACLVRFSEGDRKGAHDHFKKVVDTRFYAHIAYPYARVFLERLDSKPGWPQWIASKE